MEHKTVIKLFDVVEMILILTAGFLLLKLSLEIPLLYENICEGTESKALSLTNTILLLLIY